MSDERMIVYVDGVTDLSTAEGIAAKEAAEAAAELSGQKAGEAVDAAGRSEAAAAEITTVTGPLYATTADGIANTAVGAQFRVASTDPGVSSYRYRHDAGDVATLVETVPSAAVLGEKADETDVTARVIRAPRMRDSGRRPAAVLADGKVPLWIEGGRFDAADVTDHFRSVTMNPRVLPALNHLRSTARVPLAMMSSGVPIWLDDGRIGISSLTDGTLAMIASGLGMDVDALPTRICSDARTLRRMRGKMARRVAGVASTVVKIGITGDSWAEQKQIPQALADLLYAAHGGKSADGFIAVNGGHQLNSVVVTRAGWTTYDASNNAVPPRGCGPDGHAIYATGTAATFAVTGSTYTKLTILYWDGNGTFRYRIDGGAWVAVAGTGSNASAHLEITGLPDVAHTLEIDLNGNTGTAEIHGLIAERPGASGVTLYKMGNGSSTGYSYSLIADRVADRSAILGLDALVLILGTNDSRAGYTASDAGTFASGIAALIGAHRSANADLGCVMSFPPQHGDTVGPGDFSDYRNAAVRAAIDLHIDWYDASSEWDDWATENARGMWGDPLHLNFSGGAQRLAQGINRYMMGA